MKKAFLLLLTLCILLSGCRVMDTPAEGNGEGLMPLTTSSAPNTAMPERSGIPLGDEEAIKNVVYEYFSSRHEIRANITGEPFDAVTTHNSCQNGHIHQNTPGKPELSKVLPR